MVGVSNNNYIRIHQTNIRIDDYEKMKTIQKEEFKKTATNIAKAALSGPIASIEATIAGAKTGYAVGKKISNGEDKVTSKIFAVAGGIGGLGVSLAKNWGDSKLGNYLKGKVFGGSN